MIEKRTWQEFQDIGLLWWVNRGLHLFGWSIVMTFDAEGKLVNVCPAKVKFRGFEPEIEDDGYKRLTEYLAKNSQKLVKDIEPPNK